MKRRFVLKRAAVTALLTLALAGQCFAAGAASFSDIGGMTEKDKIVSLEERGIIHGTGGGRFEPDAPMTAAQSIQLLVNAFGLNIDNIRFIKKPKASDYFKNAGDDAWYSNAFIIISFSGLDLSSELDPGASWTREEFTHDLIQLMEKQGGLPMVNLVPADIKDGNEMNVSYSGAIQRAIYYKVVQLDPDGGFRPKEAITRGEAAVQIYNALEYLKAHPSPSIE